MRLRWPWLPRDWALVLVLPLLVGLRATYSVMVPLGESPDEWAHYKYAEYLVQHRAFPVPGQILMEGVLTETHAPPVYYVAAALATAWVDLQPRYEPRRNPYFYTGTDRSGINEFVHGPEEDFPYRGTVLAMHVARLVNVVLAAVTVVYTYRMGILLFPEGRVPALAAAAATAFVPQFVFTSSVVSNDVAPATFSAIALFHLLRIVRGKGRGGELWWLWLATVLALLSKFHALGLVPLVLYGSLVALRRSLVQEIRVKTWALGTPALLLLIGALIWWDLRVQSATGQEGTLLGEPMRFLARLAEGPQAVLAGLHWSLMPAAITRALDTSWARFGWGAIAVEPWVYQALYVMAGVSALGTGARLLRDRGFRVSGLLLLAFVALTFGLVAYFVLTRGDLTTAAGRRLLPALPAAALLLVAGLERLLPRRAAPHGLALLCVSFFAFAAIVPFRYIASAYARPPTISPAAYADLERAGAVEPLHARFGARMELLGFALGERVVGAANPMEITLFWRGEDAMSTDYTVAIKIVGRDGRVYGALDSYPGKGNYATSLWEVGPVIVDRYAVPLSVRATASLAGQVFVSVYDDRTIEHLEAVDGGGTAIGHTVGFGRLKIAAREGTVPTPPHSLSLTLGTGLRLVGYDLEPPDVRAGQPLRATLYWQAATRLEDDFNVFLHLSDGADAVRSQKDGPPNAGKLPPGEWLTEETVKDTWELPLPADLSPGQYRLYVGAYSRETGQRLPVVDPARPGHTDRVGLAAVVVH